MHAPKCFTNSRRNCRLGEAGACAICPHNDPSELPPPEAINAAELRDFAAACVRMADNAPHPNFKRHGWPWCKWCGVDDWHRCPQYMFQGAAARLRVNR